MNGVREEEHVILEIIMNEMIKLRRVCELWKEGIKKTLAVLVKQPVTFIYK